jgi:hypothetical protein
VPDFIAMLLSEFCLFEGTPAKIIPINELLAGSALPFIRHP